MAYIQSQDDEELLRQQGQQAPSSGGGGAFAGGGAATAGGAVGPGASPTGGSGGTKPFVNLQSYLAANAPTDFNKVIGEKITNPINEERNKVAGDVSGKQKLIDDQLTANSYDPNQLISSLSSGVAKLDPYGYHGWSNKNKATEAGQGGFDLTASRGAAAPFGQIQGYLGASYNPVNVGAYEQSDAVKKVAPFVSSADKFGTLSGATGAAPDVLKSIYSSNGSPLTTGQFELQKQLDLPAAASFETAKTGALDAYKGLQDVLGQRSALETANTTAAEKFGSQQQQLRSGLQNSLSEAQGQLDTMTPNSIHAPQYKDAFEQYGKYSPAAYGLTGDTNYKNALSSINRITALQKLLGG
jgi:hypothetical protein